MDDVVRVAGREVRVRQLLDKFSGGKWVHKSQEVVRLGDVGKWSMVRVLEYPTAMPFVMSRKDWDKLPVRAHLAGDAQ